MVWSLAKKPSYQKAWKYSTLEGSAAPIGLKGPCWYTILGNPWLEKLGGMQKLQRRLAKTPDIELLPYNSGVILKAGSLPPALGETNTEPLPPLLVRVNQIIRPVRFDKPRSLHFYSEYADFQFETESTMKWYRRFDEASARLDEEDAGLEEEPVRITCWTDEPAPHSGEWAAIVNGAAQYIRALEGQKMPSFEDKNGRMHRVRWSLLKRDDNGSLLSAPS
ncbi:type VI immunity family protein [Mangrovibacter yixingensis]|uniref:type VI immunity family protein n=1 Tax=Mangrovibacter yixingensis TaxID=1529639 RepID=UPI00384ECFDC